MKTDTQKNQVSAAVAQIALPKFKVDNLRHLADHGPAVEFADPKLARFVADLRALDVGEITLRAGKSRLLIRRLGKVTFTEAFFDVGSRREERCIYYSAAENLRATVFKQAHTKNYEEHAFALLRAVFLGGEIPKFFFPQNGEAKDRFADFLMRWGDLYLGESALRARAIDAQLVEARRAADSAERNSIYIAHELERLRMDSTPERFRDAHANLRENAERVLGMTKETETRLRAARTIATAPDIDDANLAAVAVNFGAVRRWNGPEPRPVYFRAEESTFSHQLLRANYSVRVSDAGEITFSSGIKAPFTFAEISAWIRGEAPAPVTRYGRPERVEVGTPDTLEPRILVVCGCHRIDVAKDVPALAPFLAPRHVVTRTAGRPEVSLAEDRPGFLARLLAEIDTRLRDNEATRAAALREFVEKRKALGDREANFPQLLAEHETRLADARAAEEAAADALARVESGENRPAGATLDDTRNVAQTLARAFSFNVSLRA